MKTIRYYYSPDYRVVNADALVYKDVSIELLEKKGKTKFLPRITVCGIYDHDTNELSIGVSAAQTVPQRANDITTASIKLVFFTIRTP